MAPVPVTPRGRPRGRPKGSTTGARTARRDGTSVTAATEPPPKRRRYVPGGPGGGGRFIEETGDETPAGPSSTVSRPRPAARAAPRVASPSVIQRSQRSTRTRAAAHRDDEDDEMQFGSAAAVAAAVVQSEGYKPREERGWEEFHPNLDIDASFMVFHAEDVDGTAKSQPATPSADARATPVNGTASPSKEGNADSMAAANTPHDETSTALTPLRRRVGRPPRDSVSFYGIRPAGTPKTPKVLPIHNQTPKEKLDLKEPDFKKTNRILLFESKTFGQARYVDKSMMNVGYQESDNFIRPDGKLIKIGDSNADEEADPTANAKLPGEALPPASANIGRVEYDMDEQDDMWLEAMNEQRGTNDLQPITREHFEITVTKIEKEWHALEKRIPKPNPKPPQTHRPRSSSAAAVNGEPQIGEEQDSKCVICDDGDCENTNAIVFCDGCDLAVHQECYGVPFIPEGQWLCRKCQLIGRGIPTCIFCPNTDGAFKQTNSSKWAHLLCAMWIPEVSLGNHTFMEPVMDVDKVPRSRWKLTCYICDQRMGACIQCSNKACYQAFHVTCARRARLYLKMKNSQGALAVLEANVPLKAFCDQHCPEGYAKENSVRQATKDARKFYRKTMKGRIWADSQASALALAATHRHAITEHPPDESQLTGAKLNAVLGGDKKKGQSGKPIWRLPSGAPVIPQAVFDSVENALQRFPIRKKKEFLAEACRYWTLKREARRGAALLKRLQLQMETFSSMELTRRNFVTMGPTGKARLKRRIEFAKTLIKDLEQLKALSEGVAAREKDKLEQAEMEQDFVDTCYFPVHKLILPVLEKAVALDKNVFQARLAKLQTKLDERYYTTTLGFAHDLCETINVGINTKPEPTAALEPRPESIDASPAKQGNYNEARDRKRLGKRILKAVQPQLESALRAESDINNKPFVALQKELEGMIEASLEFAQASITVGESSTEQSQDVIMVDAPAENHITVAADVSTAPNDEAGAEEGEPMNGVEGDDGDAGNIEVNNDSGAEKSNGVVSSNSSVAEHDPGKSGLALANGLKSTDTPPATNGYVAAPPQSQPGPPTPPQSNGSLGRGPADPLTDGGVVWYLKGFSPEGTSAIEEQWAGRDAVRSLSEELTDMDDEELTGLGMDVDHDTITASPANVATTAEGEFLSPSKSRASNRPKRQRTRSSARRR